MLGVVVFRPFLCKRCNHQLLLYGKKGKKINNIKEKIIRKRVNYQQQ